MIIITYINGTSETFTKADNATLLIEKNGMYGKVWILSTKIIPALTWTGIPTGGEIVAKISSDQVRTIRYKL